MNDGAEPQNTDLPNETEIFIELQKSFEAGDYGKYRTLQKSLERMRNEYYEKILSLMNSASDNVKMK